MSAKETEDFELRNNFVAAPAPPPPPPVALFERKTLVINRKARANLPAPSSPDYMEELRIKISSKFRTANGETDSAREREFD